MSKEAMKRAYMAGAAHARGNSTRYKFDRDGFETWYIEQIDAVLRTPKGGALAHFDVTMYDLTEVERRVTDAHGVTGAHVGAIRSIIGDNDGPWELHPDQTSPMTVERERFEEWPKHAISAAVIAKPAKPNNAGLALPGDFEEWPDNAKDDF